MKRAHMHAFPSCFIIFAKGCSSGMMWRYVFVGCIVQQIWSSILEFQIMSESSPSLLSSYLAEP